MFAKSFGKKEKILNYACQTYQLTRPSKVGAVMALIRECQPKTIEEWESFYFSSAYTQAKDPWKITKESIDELGGRLYEKIVGVVIPEWTEAFNTLTHEDCKDYVYNLTIFRTYDGYIREKSVVYDNLAKKFPHVLFEESDPDLDHAGDIDFIGKVGKFTFGLQIKPVTATANFGNYSVSERMKQNFSAFQNQHGGTVFVVYSVKEEITNVAVYEEIEKEIDRLQQLV